MAHHSPKPYKYMQLIKVFQFQHQHQHQLKHSTLESTSAKTLKSSNSESIMGIRLLSRIQNAKQILKKQSILSRNHNQPDVPKGHVAVYVGEVQRKRYVVPISYLNHPLFVDLLNRVEEEFGFNHPMGGLTIPCKEDAFIDLTSQLHAS